MGRRINTLGSAGADASCVSFFLLGRLADFADEWENLEKEAEPRLPLNAINAAKTELERIEKAEADRVAALARHTIAMDTLRGEADSLERELASNKALRYQLEFQRLDELCNTQEASLFAKKCQLDRS